MPIAKMVTLFTDFGLLDPYVGQLHAVIGECHRGARIIDLHHHAPKFQPGLASLLLEALLPYLPKGMVVVAVVDPGVGTARRAIVVEAEGRWLIGPDNGLLGPFVAQSHSRTHVLEQPSCAPSVLSDSFHGRDLFAPAGAALARGEKDIIGSSVADPIGLDEARRERVVYVDHYGNLLTGIPCARGPGQGGKVLLAGARIAPGRTFGEMERGELFWYCNSLDRIEVAAREESASRKLGIDCGAPLSLELGG